jgi:hypothetical protein
MNRRNRDRVRPEFKFVCEMWGFRADSGVGKLIGHCYDEHRVKYGTDYRLERRAKNSFSVVAGSHSDYVGFRETVAEHAAEFEVQITGA